MNLEECLPAELRGPNTTITRIAAGLSGAGVYRVEAGGQAYVLKIAGENETEADWRRALHVQRLAADAGLAPRIVHVDEARRAVVNAFVVDRSFVAWYRDPRTYEAALNQLGRTVRRIHALPLSPEVGGRDPLEFLTQIWNGYIASFVIPDFARDAIQRVLAEEPPPSDRPKVLGHNDVNPTNLVYDGEAILLLDWATAGAADAFYDLATLAVFLRMDEGTCLRLLSAYEGSPVTELPRRFLYLRRLVATLAGTMQLYLVRQMKHPGATGTETLASTLPLGEFYQQIRTGQLKLGTPEGQWAFGLSLLKESLAL